MKTPADITTARQLWWAIIGLGLIRLIATTADTIANRDRLAAEMSKQFGGAEPGGPAMPALMVLPGAIVVAVFGLAIMVLGLLAVHELGNRRQAARMVLNVAGVFLVLTAITALFSIGGEGIVPLVAGGISIVQGVLAGGAIYLVHRPESTAWFLRRTG